MGTILNIMDERKHVKEKYSNSWVFFLASVKMLNVSKQGARKKSQLEHIRHRLRFFQRKGNADKEKDYS